MNIVVNALCFKSSSQTGFPAGNCKTVVDVKLFIRSRGEENVFRWGEKIWQDVGIAVCIYCPAMPPYCHFFTSNACTAKRNATKML